ncbi:DUF6265 family protein [Flavobacterium sp.]|uniref:DUF6265 family protein n=1 Tax=Flavobacterium sp. TaxID=239 RepID=UPI00286F85D5|nr:DUF6265 family protein [Flavobacterium sp.]
MRQLYLFSIVSLLLLSCTNSHKNDKIKASEWLIGDWKNQSEEGILNETWSKPNDSTLVAGSFFIKEKDTLHFENIVLKEKEGELIYETIIKGQNNDKPILFPLLSETENELVFENLKNDYPQKIKYHRNSKTAITISISGNLAKKVVSEQFKMTKTN